LTRKEVLEMRRAIALYNSYGFGYMLGMNFRNRTGKREMLWPQDLDEILEHGETKSGCRSSFRRGLLGSLEASCAERLKAEG
jgi:hypothetical protein